MPCRRQRRWPVAGPAEGWVSWDLVGAARSLAVGLPPGVCRPTRGAPVDTRGETWVFVCAGLGGSRTVLGAAPSARGSGVHGEALGPCVRQGLWGPRRGPLNARPRGVPGRHQGCAVPEGSGVHGEAQEMCPPSGLPQVCHPRCKGELARSGAQASQEAAACDGVGHGRYAQKHHLCRVQIFSGMV